MEISAGGADNGLLHSRPDRIVRLWLDSSWLIALLNECRRIKLGHPPRRGSNPYTDSYYDQFQRLVDMLKDRGFTPQLVITDTVLHEVTAIADPRLLLRDNMEHDAFIDSGSHASCHLQIGLPCALPLRQLLTDMGERIVSGTPSHQWETVKPIVFASTHFCKSDFNEASQCLMDRLANVVNSTDTAEASLAHGLDPSVSCERSAFVNMYKEYDRLRIAYRNTPLNDKLAQLCSFENLGNHEETNLLPPQMDFCQDPIFHMVAEDWFSRPDDPHRMRGKRDRGETSLLFGSMDSANSMNLILTRDDIRDIWDEVDLERYTQHHQDNKTIVVLHPHNIKPLMMAISAGTTTGQMALAGIRGIKQFVSHIASFGGIDGNPLPDGSWYTPSAEAFGR